MPEINYLVEDNEDDFTTGELDTESNASFQEYESGSDDEALGNDDEFQEQNVSQGSFGKPNRLEFANSRELTNFNNKDQIVKSSRMRQSSLALSNNQSLGNELESEKRLSVILQNPNSNSIVIQDKSTKKFELVRLRSVNNNNNNTNSNNNNNNQLSRRNNSVYDGNNDTTESFDTNGVSNSSTNFTNPFETDIVCPHCGFIIPLSTSSTSDPNNHTDSGIPLNSDSTDPHTHNRRSSSMDNSEYDRYTSYNNNNNNNKNWYIHNDYFKLLANTEYPNIQNQEIISKYLSPLLRRRRNHHQQQQHQRQQQVSNGLNTFSSQKKRKVSDGELPVSLKLLPPQDAISSHDFDYGNNDNGGIGEINDSLPDTLFTQGYYDKFFRTIKILGNGSNGKVFKVEHVLHDLPLGIFALKKIAIGNHLSNLATILKEVTLLYKLTESTDLLNLNSFSEQDNKKGINERGGNLEEGEEGEEDIEEIKDGIKNLIKYNHVWLEIDNLSSFGPKVPCVFILFEYCDGGTLDELVESLIQPKFDINKEKEWRRLIRNRRKEDGINEIELRKQLFLKSRFLNNFEIYKIYKDIVKGVLFLHKSRILHRDLKPSNCLLKQKFSDEIKIEPVNSIYDLYKLPSIVVSDFGEGAMEGVKRNSTGATGTIEFCAPELFFTQDGNSYDNVLSRKRSITERQKVSLNGESINESTNGGESLFHLNEFSTGSDVYSLGIILYYLCFSKLPYNNGDPESIRKEIYDYKNGDYNLFKDLRKIRRIIDYNDDDITNNYKQQIRANEYILPEYIEIIEKLTDIDINRRLNCSEILHILKKVFSRLKEASIDDGGVIDGDDEQDIRNLDIVVVDEKDDQLVINKHFANDNMQIDIGKKYIDNNLVITVSYYFITLSFIYLLKFFKNEISLQIADNKEIEFIIGNGKIINNNKSDEINIIIIEFINNLKFFYLFAIGLITFANNKIRIVIFSIELVLFIFLIFLINFFKIY
ncbi:hypothetical protein B5S30_g471 [[Candida] boidinii]|nr:hypothetical protein B5S30_g471 [[Candida] boidinii]